MSNNLFLPNTFWLVLGLGTTCTIGYGTLFYSFSLLSVEFESHFSWTKEFIFGVFSLGILSSGLAAPLFGQWLDKYGARELMSIGSFLVACALCVLSQVDSKTEFIVAMVLLEILSILVLYESAFVALTQCVGKEARYPITQITLMAGFASTIFWPMISWLLSWTDWRTTYLILAAFHFCICCPVHYLVINKNRPEGGVKKASSRIEEKRTNKTSIQWLLACALGMGAFVIVSLQIHLFNILKSLSVTSTTAVIVGVLIGPSQVAARVLDMLLGRHITPMVLGFISFGIMALGIVGLLLSGSIPEALGVFAIAFGAGQGLTYIVRGAVPLYLFGVSAYGKVTGRLNSVRMILTALAPFGLALLLQYFGAYFSLIILLALMLTSILMLICVQKLDTASIA